MRWLLLAIGLGWLYATRDEDAVIDRLIDEGFIDESTFDY